MGTKINKTTRQNGNRKIVGAIQEHLKESVTFSGVKYTPARLAKLFQEGIDLADATDGAKRAWLSAVATEQGKTQNLTGLQSALRNHVSALFGETSISFTDFGFAPRKVSKVTVSTKAEAVKKSAATRTARQTMGKRQKAKVTGEVSPAAVASPTQGAPVANMAPSLSTASTPASPASNSQSNGATTSPVVLS